MSLDAARFFETVLPALARERAQAFPALAARICVVVDDRAWTLALHTGEVRAGGDPTAPCQLFLTARAFASLVDGTLDVDDAVARCHVGYRGDLRALEQLGRMLSGAGSSAFARAVTVRPR